MTERKSVTRYGRVAIILHWTIAVCVICLLAAGYVMAEFGHQLGRASTFRLIQLHKSFGMLVLVLTVARLAWRAINPGPPWPQYVSSRERFLAGISHAGFYVLLIIMPLSGWAVASAAKFKIPTMVFGLFFLPNIPYFATHPAKREMATLTLNTHIVLASLMAGMIVLHVAGALRHHMILKDDMLRRMLPGRSA